jgi:Flp pilus assembly protein TadG
MSGSLGQRLRAQDGAVLISGLLLALALLMLIGAGTDIGRAFIVHRELVAAADDAALSGSQALNLDALHAGKLSLNPTAAQQAALASLSGEPDLQAQAIADSSSVQVRVQRQIPTILLRLVGLPSLTLAAQATAAPHAP